MKTCPRARLTAMAISATTGALGLMLLLGGCASAPSGEIGPLSHQVAYQPGLIASVERPQIPGWAIDSRANHHVNPQRSESGYLLEETVITQRQRLWNSNGRPREASSFRTWTWQLGISPRP